MKVTMRYLHPHPKTATICYRRRVPKDLVPLLGKSSACSGKVGIREVLAEARVVRTQSKCLIH